jgi:hypothetical protein
LVEDHVQRELALYPSKPDAKAVAISGAAWRSVMGWGTSYGAPDQETASKEALERCRARTTAECRLYAAGPEVVWPRELLPDPLPGDLRAAALEVAMTSQDLPANFVKRWVVPTFLSRPNHKALAITRSDFWYVYNKGSGAEAARLARERCTYAAQVSCLVISIDGLLTVQIPKTHRIVDIFLLANAQDISPEDKQRIAHIYEGGDWRALARSKTGTWYPVANRPSEAAAVEAALTECASADRDCHVHAIGNFLVSDEKS